MAALALARVYRHSFHAYPNWTLAITGGCLSAAGDIVAQLTQNAVRWSIDHLYHRVTNAFHRWEAKTMKIDPSLI